MAERTSSRPGAADSSQTSSTGRTSSDGSSEKGGIANRVRESAVAQLSTQKDRAADGIGSVTAAVRQSTSQLRDQQHDVIARYVEQAADQIDRFAQSLRQKDVRELVDDAQRLARRQPAAFIGSAFAIGLIAARFAKSSAKDARDDYADMRWSSRDRNVAGTYGAGSRAAMAHEVSRPAVAHDVTASTSAGETSESGRTARTGRATSATGARTRRQGPETERS